jgi:hypothetical protein
MLLRKDFAMKLSATCILLSSIVNVPLLRVETHIVDIGHEVPDVTGAAAQIEYALAGFEFGETIEAESSQAIRAQGALQPEVGDRVLECTMDNINYRHSQYAIESALLDLMVISLMLRIRLNHTTPQFNKWAESINFTEGSDEVSMIPVGEYSRAICL